MTVMDSEGNEMNKHLFEACVESANVFAQGTMIETKVLDADGSTIHQVHQCYSQSIHQVAYQNTNQASCPEVLRDDFKQCICCQISKSLCRQSHLFGAHQAFLFGGSYIFFCPIGLVHFVSPIVVKGKMVGALLSGEVLMTEPDVYLIRYILKYVDDERVVKDFVNDVKVYSPKQIKALSELLKILAISLSDGSEMIKENLEMPECSKAKHLHVIHKVTNYINRGYMNKLTLEDAAGHVHFTSQYLSKIFKEETGYTFVQYLSRIRVEKSKRMLEQSGISQSEISYLTGFSDQSHFSRTFKKITGMSPSTYQSSFYNY